MSIKATLTAPTVEGPIAQPFDLFFDGYGRPVRLWLDGEARLAFPQRMDLGAFSERTEQQVEMYAAAKTGGFRVSRVECRDGRVHVTADAEGTLHVETDRLAVGERVETFADIFFVEGAPLPSQRMWMRGMASGGLLIEPDTMSFGLTRVDAERIVKEASVASTTDNAPFTLETASIGADQLSVALERTTPTETILRITLTPSIRGALDAAVTVATPDRTRGVTLRCIGTIQ